MKKTIFLFVFTILLLAGHAQPYRPFPTNQAEWRQVSRQFFMPMEEQWDYKYSISWKIQLNSPHLTA